MRVSKSFLVGCFLLIVFICFLYLASIELSKVFQTPSTPPQVLGAKTNTIIFEQPGAGREPILEAIQNAHQEILVEVYLLSDKQIIQALEGAKTRGLVVKVMLEEHPFGGGSLNDTTKSLLENNNVDVEWSNSSFALTHEKAIIIDSTEAFILDQNLTASSFTKNREYDVIDTNLEDVTEIRNIFNADWDRKSYTPQSSHLVVSPITSRTVLEKLIQAATKTIDVEIEDIDDDEIVSLLSTKAKTLQVRIIVPTLKQIKSNEKAVQQLRQEGVSLRELSTPYIHAKLLLIDDAEAYTGSVNFSTQSMDKNRELGIVLLQPDIIQKLDSSFESDWSRGREVN